MSGAWAAVLVICILVQVTHSRQNVALGDGDTPRDGRQLAQLRQQQSIPPPPSPDLTLTPGWTWDRYHNYSELTAFLSNLDLVYRHVKVYSIGTSFQGRQLWVAQLTGDVSSGKPPLARRRKFKYVGNMHGDETANRELLLRLIHHLASNYGKDSRITALMDNTDIHILPSMNPDGFEIRIRNNLQGKDLNRNWPLNNSAYARSGLLPSWKPGEASSAYYSYMATGYGPLLRENQLVMSWSKQHNFPLSANMHGGALVANYPYDVCDAKGVVKPCPTTMDPLPRFLAHVYSLNHPTMATNNNPYQGFSSGTVNGAAWYQVFGGMQDWMNFNTPGLELTLELHEIKDPPASTLPGMWLQNASPLLRYMEMVWLGLDARVATRTGAALSGTVSVTRPVGWRVTAPRFTSAQDGRFFLLLAPDTLYCIRVQPSGTWQPIIMAVQLQGSTSSLISGTGLAGLTVPANLVATRRSGAEAPVRLALGAATAAMASSC